MCSRLRRYAVEALFTRSEHDRCMGVILSIDTLKFVRSPLAPFVSCCPTMLESTANVGLFETAESEMLYGTVDLNSVSSSSAAKERGSIPSFESSALAAIKPQSEREQGAEVFLVAKPLRRAVYLTVRDPRFPVFSAGSKTR